MAKGPLEGLSFLPSRIPSGAPDTVGDWKMAGIILTPQKEITRLKDTVDTHGTMAGRQENKK